jgi:prepilin-type N-terminal cleavage/methylation domain-containing protein
MNARGFSLTELLISMGVIVILLVAVGAAIVQTLHVQSFHLGRAGTSRTITSLGERMAEEARSSTAVFVPSTDVLGQPNGGPAGAHEVDFFRRLSSGGDAYTAYRFDAPSGVVTRYEYSLGSGPASVTAEDLAASGITAFSAMREGVALAATVAGTTAPPAVSIGYGSPGLTGGNDVVVVSIRSASQGDVPGSSAVLHLASRAAPTALALLTAKSVPTPPSTTRVFPFILLRPGFPVTPPHGPMHGGSPGGPGSLIHWIAAFGSVQFLGPSGESNWFELSSVYAKVESGVYPFRDSHGASITAIVSCSDGPCPAFHPLPVSAPGLASGSVAFALTH